MPSTISYTNTNSSNIYEEQNLARKNKHALGNDALVITNISKITQTKTLTIVNANAHAALSEAFKFRRKR
jgi:hypothetical protein